MKPTGRAIDDMNTAFDIAEKNFNIPKLLEAEYVVSDPDELSIMTYVSYFRKVFIC